MKSNMNNVNADWVSKHQNSAEVLKCILAMQMWLFQVCIPLFCDLAADLGSNNETEKSGQEEVEGRLILLRAMSLKMKAKEQQQQEEEQTLFGKKKEILILGHFNITFVYNTFLLHKHKHDIRQPFWLNSWGLGTRSSLLYYHVTIIIS